MQKLFILILMSVSFLGAMEKQEEKKAPGVEFSKQICLDPSRDIAGVFSMSFNSKTSSLATVSGLWINPVIREWDIKTW